MLERGEGTRGHCPFGRWEVSRGFLNADRPRAAGVGGGLGLGEGTRQHQHKDVACAPHSSSKLGPTTAKEAARGVAESVHDGLEASKAGPDSIWEPDPALTPLADRGSPGSHCLCKYLPGTFRGTERSICTTGMCSTPGMSWYRWRSKHQDITGENRRGRLRMPRNMWTAWGVRDPAGGPAHARGHAGGRGSLQTGGLV